MLIAELFLEAVIALKTITGNRKLAYLSRNYL